MIAAVVKHILIRDKYINEKSTPAQCGEAVQKWRADHPYLPPLHPSAVDSSREAECQICLDLEMVHPRINGQPDYSQLIPCTCGEAQRKAAAARIAMEHSGIPNTSSRSYTFKTFKDESGTEKAKEAAMVLATGHAPFKVLLLYGDVGNGKTHLLYATASFRLYNESAFNLSTKLTMPCVCLLVLIIGGVIASPSCGSPALSSTRTCISSAR